MKRILFSITFLALPLLGATIAPAATYYILPDGTGDAPTIQAGLDLCLSGDTVLVAEGNYVENLVWPSVDGIVLVSESGAETTGIDGNALGSVITIGAGVTELTRIEGFTILNGEADRGGGILCQDGASPTITRNVITGNHAVRLGGGICCRTGSAALIIDNVITDNRVDIGNYAGGGIGAKEASPRIYNNVITHNIGGGGSGGVHVGEDSSARVVNNTIEHNTALYGGGLMAWYCTGYIAYNTIRWNNSEYEGGGIRCAGSKAQLMHNEITFNTVNGLYGGGGISCFDADSSVIDGCLITDNAISGDGGGGIECSDNTAPTIRNCTIANNASCGIFCEKTEGIPGAPGGNPLIINNNILGHPQHGVCNTDDRLMVDARENWWGDATGPSGAGFGFGDAVNEYVLFEPWADVEFYLALDVEPVTPPARIELAQNAPNPFNPATRIAFRVPMTAPVRLTVHDVRGRLVATLVNEVTQEGRHEVLWQGRDDRGGQVASGVYFARLVCGGEQLTRKMVLAK